MKEKTREPKPLVRIEHEGDRNYSEIYVLDEGDSMAWNQSTHYDHHMSGPSLVTKHVSPNGTELNEYHVNDPNPWNWINRMMQLGKKFIEQNPDFDVWEHADEIKEEMEGYKPHVSHFKNKKD